MRIQWAAGVGAAALAVSGPAMAVSITTLAVSGTALAAQRGIDPAQEWRYYNHSPDGTRYSPLDQINRNNVDSLVEAWSHPAGGQTVPIVADGVMYISSPEGVTAVQPETGAPRWTYLLQGGRGSNRGLTLWPGDGGTPPRVFYTAGQRLIAINALTGEQVTAFGTGGETDIEVPYNGAPTLLGDIVMVGATLGEVPQGDPGNTRAYDARTGEKLWEFNSVPQPGEIGHDTWEDGWDPRSGVNVWAFNMTVDEDRRILYMPLSSPAANYWGGDRPGSNLFGNSLVAVNADTGEYIWHFQTVHHDLWDMDQPAPPALLDIVTDGESVAALVLVGKTGLMYILDRVTGEPIFGVEERPAPAGSVPGEWYSPTQPFPVKPPPLARMSFTPDEMVTADDTMPEHADACRDLWDRSGGFRNEGPYTPFLFKEADAPPVTTVQFPGAGGGVNWGGVSADPTTGYVFVNSSDSSLAGWIEEKVEGGNYGRGTKGSNQPYDRASINGPGPYNGFNARVEDAEGNFIGNLPCQKPPWSRLIAVNANTGDIAWETVLGINENLPEGKQNVGGSGSAGPTATGGGLVFVGATNDRRFRAFDSDNGEELWTATLAGNGGSNPITYMGADGKQYVGIVANGQFVTFTLP